MHLARGTREGQDTMKLKVDEKADALYLRLNEEAIVESEEVQPGVILDYDDAGRVIGVEILDVASRAGKESLRSLLFERA